METFVQGLTILVVLIGTTFSFLGILGMIRMPDVYTRLHATGKVGVFGVAFLLLAAALWTPVSFGKTIVIVVLILLTGPVTTHALASTAYRLGIPFQVGTRNDLELRSPKVEVSQGQVSNSVEQDSPPKTN